MIIRTNLASSPIKNYSLFLFGCVLLGVAVALFTFFNLTNISDSYSKNLELKKTITTQQTQLVAMEEKAKELQDKINRIKTAKFVSETEFMNNAIKRRTFSWTSLFDHFEEVLPPTVKMISVIPIVEENNIAIKLEMAGKNLSDMLELVRTLERDAQFSDVTLKAERAGDEDLIYFSVSLNYNPPATASTSATNSEGTTLVAQRFSAKGQTK
jgi:Tfp pilus assembly protein PilN